MGVAFGAFCREGFFWDNDSWEASHMEYSVLLHLFVIPFLTIYIIFLPKKKLRKEGGGGSDVWWRTAEWPWKAVGEG